MGELFPVCGIKKNAYGTNAEFGNSLLFQPWKHTVQNPSINL